MEEDLDGKENSYDDEEYLINNPIIIIIGISIYSDIARKKGYNENLDGVPRDYEHLIDMFTKKWNYYVCYKQNDNTIVYTNNVEDAKDANNFKITWTKDQIVAFCEQARDRLLKTSMMQFYCL